MKPDVDWVVPRLRDADRREVLAAAGLPAAIVMQGCLDISDRAWALEAPDGEPVAILGTQPVFDYPDVGRVWMVATDKLAKHPFEFLRQCRQGLPEVFGNYHVLTNFVDARNALHIKWLRFMGFKFLRVIPDFGAGALPFIEFAGVNQACADPHSPSSGLS